MANAIDLTTPKVVTITNTVTKERAEDAGALQKSSVYEVDKDTFKDKSELTDEEIAVAKKAAFRNTDRKVQMYKANTYITLELGQSVKITTSFPEEIAYFLSLASKDLKVEVAAAATEATGTDSNPEG